MDKKVFFFTLLLLSLFGGAVRAENVISIAYVNVKQILEQAPQVEQVREMLNQEFATRQASLNAGDKKLAALKERLERYGASMAEEERRKVEREVLTHEREMKRSHEEYTEDRNIRNNEQLAKMQREIRLTIVSLAKEMNYDLVLEAGVMYASERVDITALVLERLKRDFSQHKPTIKQ